VQARPIEILLMRIACAATLFLEHMAAQRNLMRTPEERIRRQKARETRIREQMKFPWKSVLIGFVCAVVILVFLGPSLMSLFLVAGLGGTLCASRRGGGRFPF
jgi:hypothetical protein